MRIVVISLLAVLASGCVGKAKYNALQDQYQTAVQENEALAQKLVNCKEGLGKLKKGS
jgi:hypothetical protein